MPQITNPQARSGVIRKLISPQLGMLSVYELVMLAREVISLEHPGWSQEQQKAALAKTLQEYLENLRGETEEIVYALARTHRYTEVFGHLTVEDLMDCLWDITTGDVEARIEALIQQAELAYQQLGDLINRLKTRNHQKPVFFKAGWKAYI